ncbi:MAG TPA: Imm8 family immunity protein [Gemmataceae bacterium]|nr:Imm8 family immunity protein [Gemmataceae bacterium]
MRAELPAIEPNDYLGWGAFVATDRPTPWDDFGWFTLSIAPVGDPGSDYFQVLISTPAAVSRAKAGSRTFRGLVVASFEPAVIAQTLRDHIASLQAHTWQDLVDQLRRTMLWEYEGMGPDRR